MNIIGQVKSYIIEVKGEMKKVSWPTRKRAIRDSAIVVGVSLATAAFLGGVDYIFAETINKLIIK